MGVGSQIGRSLGEYVKTVAQNAVITVLLFIAGFAIAALPWWLLVGTICGLINLIPQIGPVIALAVGVLVQFLTTHDWVRVAEVGAVWLLIQIIDGFILSPRAASRSGVNPFLSIVLVFLGGLLFGPFGLLLAVPVAAVVLIIARGLRPRAREGPPLPR